MKPRYADGLAMALAILAALVSAGVADRVFERIPHIEDEFANLWQAEVMAEGQIYLPSPDHSRSFLVPFVVDHGGRRFGKYPPGWPATLSLGVRAGIPWLVSPLLGGVAVWLVYRLGDKIAGRGVGLLAALLTATSPMFLMLSGTMMSHNLSLTLAAAFSLSWLDLFPEARRVSDPARVPTWLLVSVAGLTLGLLTITRPLTALGVVVPFAVHGLVLLIRGDGAARRRLLSLGGLALAVMALLPLWQAALTGDPFLNPYTLWWEYDMLGFGPGVGVTEAGHNLRLAYSNTRFSLRAGMHDLFGWPFLSWLFLPFGLFALRRRRDGWLMVSTFPCMVIVYAAYWIGSWLFGPRYYYEALPALAVASAAGVAWLGGWLGESSRMVRPRRLAMTAFITLLISLNCIFYLPVRVGKMQGLYGITRTHLVPLQQADLKNALVLVHSDSWHRYGTLLMLASPFSPNDVLVAWGINPELNVQVIRDFSDRSVYHYYPDDPHTLYLEPRQGIENGDV